MVEDLAGEEERRGERSLRESSRRTRVALAPRGRSFRRRRLLGSKHKALEAHYHHVRATPSGIAPPCRAPCALRRPEKKGKKGGSDDQADRGTSELPRALSARGREPERRRGGSLPDPRLWLEAPLARRSRASRERARERVPRRRRTCGRHDDCERAQRLGGGTETSYWRAATLGCHESTLFLVVEYVLNAPRVPVKFSVWGCGRASERERRSACSQRRVRQREGALRAKEEDAQSSTAAWTQS